MTRFILPASQMLGRPGLPRPELLTAWRKLLAFRNPLYYAPWSENGVVFFRCCRCKKTWHVSAQDLASDNANGFEVGRRCMAVLRQHEVEHRTRGDLLV